MDAGCGHCGQTPVQTITLELHGEELELNVCDRHMRDVLRGARPEAPVTNEKGGGFPPPFRVVTLPTSGSGNERAG